MSIRILIVLICIGLQTNAQFLDQPGIKTDTFQTIDFLHFKHRNFKFQDLTVNTDSIKFYNVDTNAGYVGGYFSSHYHFDDYGEVYSVLPDSEYHLNYFVYPLENLPDRKNGFVGSQEE